jgi:hypothetical protein
MGMRVTNLGEVKLMFSMMDREIPARAREVLKQGAQDIRKTAIAFAPVDLHNLEGAIHVLPYRGNQYMFRAVIDVSGVVGGRDVSVYATIVHEYPWSKRGPKTRAKSPRAGPRYLGRAVEANQARINKELRVAMATGIASSIARSGVNKPRARRSR